MKTFRNYLILGVLATGMVCLGMNSSAEAGRRGYRSYYRTPSYGYSYNRGYNRGYNRYNRGFRRSSYSPGFYYSGNGFSIGIGSGNFGWGGRRSYYRGNRGYRNFGHRGHRGHRGHYRHRGHRH